MFGSRQSKTDNTQHSLRRTRNFLEAVDVVAEGARKDFGSLSVEGKQAFLKEHHAEIVDTCIAKYGIEYQNLNNFHWFVVENQGSAMIFFEKKSTTSK